MRTWCKYLGAAVLTVGLLTGSLNLYSGRHGQGVAQAAAQEPESHIHDAIVVLRLARAELKASPHDYGGHRAAAVEAIGATIEQLHECESFDP